MAAEQTKKRVPVHAEMSGRNAFFYDINVLANPVGADQIVFEGIEHFDDRIVEKEILKSEAAIGL